MSNRALRRLQQSQGIGLIPGADVGGEVDGEEEEEDFVPQPVRKKNKARNVNPFELLADDGEKEEEEEKEMADGPADDQDASASVSTTSKKKKNKKKKKKKAIEVTESPAEEVEDEVEASIQEVNRILGEAGVSTPEGGSDQQESQFTVNMKALLSVEYKYLNADNELRRRFGFRAMQGEQGGRTRERNRRPQRQSRLVQVKDTWPHFGRTGLSMSVTETSGGGTNKEQTFTFEHNAQYRQAQFLFLDAVQSYSPQNIANVNRDHPYHMDTLLQLSEVFYMHEDAQTAVDLIERALYVFEGAFHPRFNLATGNCRLDFRRQENRSFFLVVFKHLLAVGQRGCNRTALEFCKLLLSLDPDGDPMCVLLMIDLYALRCEQYSFLVRLFEEWEPFRNLSQLPNFAFSVPLAMYHLGTDNPTMAQRADSMLEESLLMFPGLLMCLLDKCGVSPDKEVTDHAFFGSAVYGSHTQALQQLIALYVARTHTLWKNEAVVQWLETVVRSTLRLVDTKDPRVASFAEKRRVRYQGTPRNIYRHIIVSNIRDATIALPPDLANTAVLSYDPLPPLDAIVSYNRPERPQVAGEGENVLSLFLRSLLPNFNAQGGQNDEAPGRDEGRREGEEEGAAGGGNAELRHGVGVLMDAMRDLLNNIRMAPPPVDNPQGEGEGGEEDREVDEWD